MLFKILICIIPIILSLMAAFGVLVIQDHLKRNSLSTIESFVVLMLYTGIIISAVGIIGYILDKIFT